MKQSALSLVAIACAFPLLAQAPSAPKLITLNLAATNARDEPVTDLHASDLQLREDGKAQPIGFFRFSGSAGSWRRTPRESSITTLLRRQW